jgi:CopG family transcriptional regulator, nickel-responsive regulator
MRPITISIDDELLATLEQRGERRGYKTRPAPRRCATWFATRPAARRSEHDESSPCLATLTYVYEHEKRDLARRLTHAQHDQHDLSLAILHIHLDQQNCLEVARS